MASLDKKLEDINVQKFANDYKIAKANLRIFSFYLFHKCQFNCVKDLTNKNTEECFKQCENDLDQYFDYKSKNKIAHVRDVLYAIPSSDYVSPNTQKPFTDQERHEYHKRCIDTEIRLQDYVNKLQYNLNNLNTKYTVPGGK